MNLTIYKVQINKNQRFATIIMLLFHPVSQRIDSLSFITDVQCKNTFKSLLENYLYIYNTVLCNFNFAFPLTIIIVKLVLLELKKKHFIIIQLLSPLLINLLLP